MVRINKVRIIWGVFEKLQTKAKSSVYEGSGRKSYNNPPPPTPLRIHYIHSILFHSFTVEILSSTREWMEWTSLTLCTETGTMTMRAGKWTPILTWKITYVIYQYSIPQILVGLYWPLQFGGWYEVEHIIENAIKIKGTHLSDRPLSISQEAFSLIFLFVNNLWIQ